MRDKFPSRAPEIRKSKSARKMYIVDDEILITQAGWEDCHDYHWGRLWYRCWGCSGCRPGWWGANCGSWSGTPNLDIVRKKFVVKAFAVKADVVGRAGVVRAMIQEEDVLVNDARLSFVAVHDKLEP